MIIIVAAIAAFICVGNGNIPGAIVAVAVGLLLGAFSGGGDND